MPAGGWLWDTPAGSMLRAAKAGPSQRRLLRPAIVFGGGPACTSSPFAAVEAGVARSSVPLAREADQTPRRTVSAGPVLLSGPSNHRAQHKAPRNSVGMSSDVQAASTMLTATVDALCPTDPAPCFFAACLIRRLLGHAASHTELVQRLDVLSRLLTVLMTCTQRAAALQVHTWTLPGEHIPNTSTHPQALAALQVASMPLAPASTRRRLLATPQLLATLLGLSCGQQHVPSLPGMQGSGAWTTHSSWGGTEGGEVEQWTTLCLDDAPLTATSLRWVGGLWRGGWGGRVGAGGCATGARNMPQHREGDDDPRLPMALRASEALRNLAGLLDSPRLVAMVRYVRSGDV